MCVLTKIEMLNYVPRLHLHYNLWSAPNLISAFFPLEEKYYCGYLTFTGVFNHERWILFSCHGDGSVVMQAQFHCFVSHI